MYVKRDDKDIVILLIWVDDIVVVSSNAFMLDEVKAMLSQKFKTKDIGVISRFLGIDFKSVLAKLQWAKNIICQGVRKIWYN